MAAATLNVGRALPRFQRVLQVRARAPSLSLSLALCIPAFRAVGLSSNPCLSLSLS